MDFDLIWKKINGISTPEEDKALDAWLREDARHRAFYEKAEKYYREETARHTTVTDVKYTRPKDAVVEISFPTDSYVETALLNVKQQIDSKTRIRKIKIRKYAVPLAAAMLAGVIVTTLFLFFPPKSSLKETTVASITPESSPVITPGKNKATLTVDNGESYELSGEETVSLELEGVRITGKGTEIEYLADADKKTEELRYNTLSVPTGGEFFVILSDSTKVWLNSETELRYPVKFGEGERVVELKGEAFFAVAKDAARPFRVQSRGQVVEALGTEFNITAYADESAVLTTLVEGKVKVSVSAQPESFSILLPGNQSRFLPESREIGQYAVNIEEFVSWKEGWFVFRNAMLADMMKTLSRWYNFDVAFENEKTRNIRFTGDIKRYDNLEKLLSVIEKTNEVKIKIEEKIVIIN